MLKNFYDNKQNCINLKHPLLLGVISGIITYMYLYWDSNNNRNNKEKKPKKIDPMIPITIGVVIWFLATNFFDESDNINNIRNNNIQEIISDRDIISIDLNNDDLISENSYKLIGKKNVDTINQDMFIDLPRW
tara:strand:+ start:545 stop:943 length:399 start_codon:yes stop_codon:yes gene_type:complete